MKKTIELSVRITADVDQISKIPEELYNKLEQLGNCTLDHTDDLFEEFQIFSITESEKQ